MKRSVLIAASLLAVSFSAFAQAPADAIEKALAAAPRNMKEAATVIQWKADNTYDTLRQGTNKLVCYDRSNEAGRPAFAVQCTVLANLPRVAQSRKFEAIADAAERKKALDAAEADGTRVKPEFGSMFISLSGPDQAHARMHTTVAVPGATAKTLGLPENPAQGGAWVMNPGTSTAHIMTPGI